MLARDKASGICGFADWIERANDAEHHALVMGRHADLRDELAQPDGKRGPDLRRAAFHGSYVRRLDESHVPTPKVLRDIPQRAVRPAREPAAERTTSTDA